jgi:hypothetical protein
MKYTKTSFDLACRPTAGLAPTWIAVARPASMMACLTLTTGAILALKLARTLEVTVEELFSLAAA